MAITETIPFNFEENYEFIQNKFKEKGYDLEEGSNTMQLVTAMSYLTSMLNANTAVNVNETILPLANKRKNILQDSRVLGYELDHIRSYRYNIEINLPNDTGNTISTVIPRYTSFTANGLTYYYMGETKDVDVPNGGKNITLNVVEGTLLKYTDPNQQALTINILGIEEDGVLKPQESIDVPYTDVEENGIEVFLTYYDEFGEYRRLEKWSRSEVFMIDTDTNLSKEFVRIDDIDYGTPRVYFKIQGVGKSLRIGTIVNMNILKSSGASGKMTEIPAPVDLNASVLGYTLDLVGANEESNESIKRNAPLFYNTANRVISKSDYVSFCNRFAEVKSTQVWDGHDEKPNVPGHIWFSFVPSHTTREITPTDSTNVVYEMQDVNNVDKWYLDQKQEDGSTDPDIQDIYDFLGDYKVPTLVFHHRNPVYMDFSYNIGVVKYNLSQSKREINKKIFDVINEYFTGKNPDGSRKTDNPVEVYQFEYFQSNLTKRIDTELTDLTGFNITLTTSIPLHQNNIIDNEKVSAEDANGNPTAYYHEMIFHLGFPYEDIIDDNGNIITTELPSIDTTGFIDTDNLYLDKSVVDDTTLSNVSIYNIMLGTGSSGEIGTDDKIGEYRIHTGVVKTIEVIIFITTTDGHTGILESDLSPPKEVTIQYPSSNLRFSRNTIPRLRQVNFV